jgi:hypothetical protein
MFTFHFRCAYIVNLFYILKCIIIIIISSSSSSSDNVK